MTSGAPRLLLLYHYVHPDDVVSARIFSDLAQEQQRRGWQVTLMGSNRIHLAPRQRLPAHSQWEGVRIERVYRPGWSQRSPLARLANTAFVLSGWLARAARLGRFDAAVVGSDPSFAALVAPGLKRLHPGTPVAHWCFDVFPDAGVAEWPSIRPVTPLAGAAMRLAYRSCDVVADLGPCMRRRLERYGVVRRRTTLTPWALTEPERPAEADPRTRAGMFGKACLGLLYAGSLGRSHDVETLVALARACRARAGDDVAFCFAGTGIRFAALRASVGAEDTNVRLLDFALESELLPRLAAADMHMVSLRPQFTGVVVPSKFFAALAVGRPVLFAGARDSAVAGWIEEERVGLVLSSADVERTADRLVALTGEPQQLTAWRERSFEAYHRRFSRRVINDGWSELLDGLRQPRSPAET
jgi:colanic acid biosynthesis glycosyl transferase WcaI